MVSSAHEAPHRLIQEDPELIARLAGALGQSFPETRSVSVFATDATELKPVERRIDSAFKFETYQQGDFLVLVEVQRKKDEVKLDTWTYYQAYMRERHGIPTMLMVLCPSEKVGDWAAGPHRIGPDFCSTLTLHPIVLSPRNIPKIVDLDVAVADIPLAALSAILHGESPDGDLVMRTLAAALAAQPAELTGNVATYAELVELGLGDSQAAQNWRTMVSVDLSFFRSETSQKLRAEGREQGVAEGREQGVAEGREQGVAEGRLQERARAVVVIMKVRGVSLTDAEVERVQGCADEAQIDRWYDRSVSAASAVELFAQD